MGLLKHYAKKEHDSRIARSQPTLPVDDLVNEGVFGLVRAMDKFDFDKGVKVSTYAVWWVRRSMQRANQNLSREIRIPVHANENIRHIGRFIGEYCRESGTMPTEEEIADALDMSLAMVRGALLKQPYSMNDVMGDSDTEYGDFIEADGLLPEDEVISSDMMDRLDGPLSTMNPRERYVLEQRYIKERTLREMSDEMGISREWVRQLEKRAKEKARTRILERLGDDLE